MNKLNEEKLKMWRKQEEELQAKLKETMLARGKAAQEGDLKENAAYLLATEDAEMISARLGSVQKIIAELERAA